MKNINKILLILLSLSFNNISYSHYLDCMVHESSGIIMFNKPFCVANNIEHLEQEVEEQYQKLISVIKKYHKNKSYKQKWLSITKKSQTLYNQFKDANCKSKTFISSIKDKYKGSIGEIICLTESAEKRLEGLISITPIMD